MTMLTIVISVGNSDDPTVYDSPNAHSHHQIVMITIDHDELTCAHLAAFTCSWPWSIAVMLCDGRIVCGCADPYAKRVLGDTRTATLATIWTGATASQLRSRHQRRRLHASAAIVR